MSLLKTVSFILLVSYLVVLTIGTHIPLESLPEVRTSDKILHLVAYSGVGLLLGLNLVARRQWQWSRIAFGYGLFLLWAAADELTQPWVNRFADFGDWVANAIGLVAGLLLCQGLRMLIGERRVNEIVERSS